MVTVRRDGAGREGREEFEFRLNGSCEDVLDIRTDSAIRMYGKAIFQNFCVIVPYFKIIFRNTKSINDSVGFGVAQGRTFGTG
jgi:hypothetical protein